MNSDYSDKKIMTLFKSKHHKRILRKIAELEDQRATLVFDREKIKQTLNPSKFAELSRPIWDIENYIKLLKGLL